MSEYLDVMRKSTTNIQDAAYELREIGRAFFQTGNAMMGERMWDMAEVLMEAQKGIDVAVGRELNDRCRASQQSAYNTVAACLSVAATVEDTEKVHGVLEEMRK